jgi:hypothetical protein
MYAQAIIPTFLTSNIYIKQCLANAVTLTQLQWYEMFEVLVIDRINKTMSLRGFLNFRLLRDPFPYQLVRGITPMEGVP